MYGLEREGSLTGLVLELVEGETLHDTLARGVLPVADALPVACQIAEALESAHEKGVVHRDLKPANIKITAEGKVKVLDFGLAKMLERDAAAPTLSASPTVMSAQPTYAGVILGTAAYMSPEQSRGKLVDRRTDIWAFGCVLFEMLTGKQAFEGETVTDLFAAILKTEPDWAALPASIPESIQRLLRQCLQKDARRRLQHSGDARIALEDPVELAVPPKTDHASNIATDPANEVRAQISPDGKWIAFESNETGRSEIYVKTFPSGEIKRQISADGAVSPRWSGDGKELFFLSAGAKMTSVKLTNIGSTANFSAPTVLFDTGLPALSHSGGSFHFFAVSPDGTRFLIPRQPDTALNDAGAIPITVIVNWFATLK